MMDITAHARDLLETNTYVVLGTADTEGRPWTTPVWFAPEGLHRLYWASWPGARHSRLIEQRPEVALTVFDSRAVPNEGAAFYATAHARRCPEERLDDGLRTFNRRADAQRIGRFTRERVSGPARLRLYVAELTDRWVLDQDAEVDRRVRVPA
jgi:uncharacterized protein YhbP (UPF0306 family)